MNLISGISLMVKPLPSKQTLRVRFSHSAPYSPVAHLDRALVCGTRGKRFESSQASQNFLTNSMLSWHRRSVTEYLSDMVGKVLSKVLSGSFLADAGRLKSSLEQVHVSVASWEYPNLPTPTLMGFINSTERRRA